MPHRFVAILASAYPVFAMAAHAALVLHGAWIHSAMIDEPAHLAAGLFAQEGNHFDLYRVNPPLYRQLATIPVSLADPVRVNPEIAHPPAGIRKRMEWEVGFAFVLLNEDRWQLLLFLGRIAGACWSCLAAYLIFRWCRERFGPGSGNLGISIWCFHPEVIANAHLLTSDIPATACGLLAVWLFRRYLRNPTRLAALVTGAGLAAALLMKFTLLVLLPVNLVILVVHRSEFRGVKARCTHAVIAMSAVLALINLDYCFAGFGDRLDKLPLQSRLFLSAVRETPVGWVRLPLPSEFLLGIDEQRYDFERFQNVESSYLRGEWKKGGWWYYYLYAIAVKTPLGFLILLVGSAVAVLFLARHRGAKEEWFLYLPAFGVLALVSSQLGFNHHGRYTLPALPFLIVGASRFGSASFPRIVRRFSVLCVVWGTASSLIYYPHSHSYFNELVGGPRHGPDHLLNSNLEWGQDARLLSKWFRDHPEARPMRSGIDTPVPLRIEGIESDSPPSLGNGDPEGLRGRLEPGWYAVSVNCQRGGGWVHL